MDYVIIGRVVFVFLGIVLFCKIFEQLTGNVSHRSNYPDPPSYDDHYYSPPSRSTSVPDQRLADSTGRPIGHITTDSDGVQHLYNAGGLPVGTYEPKTNTTRNNNGYPVGTGNILTSLL